MNTIRRLGVYILLVGIYGFTWLVVALCGMIPRRRWEPNGRIMVVGTFHNHGWYLSHISPLSRSGLKEVILVVDELQLPLEGVTFVCWPRWASKLLSRPLARAIWVMITSFRYRPDLYMGYHLGPGSCTTLMVGKLMGRPACYQMTGGPVEIIGGGFEAAESIGAPLGHPSRLIEILALAVVNLFDLIVVRGNKAREFLISHNIKRPIAIITGSVRNGQMSSQNKRDAHLIFVGRLSPVKQIDQFIEIVNSIKQAMPDIRAVIVGDGSLMAEMKEYASKLCIINNIDFLGKKKEVEKIFARSKIFVLTSKSEGLSIAMAEAMASGVVPVVANVGELGDLVIDGVNGYLVEPGNISEYTNKILYLLQNPRLWSQYSSKAIEAVRERCSIEVITRKWQKHLRDTVSRASDCSP